jgi:phospholipid transport system substrate-binding protein
MTAIRLGLATLLLLTTWPGAVRAADLDAAALRAPVEALYAALLDVMQRADVLGFEGRYRELEPVVEGSYDVAFMAERVLGRRYQTLTPDQQAQWRSVFARLTVSTYADRFDGFADEKFEVGAVEPGSSGTAIVHTRIVPTGEDPVELNYRLRDAGGGWRIVDVYLSGTVSELALRRSEYSGVLKRDGFDALRSAVEAKIAAAEAGTDEDDS